MENYYADKLVKWLNEEHDAKLTEDDIKVTDYDDSTYETPFGTFTVLTDEQANALHQDRIESLIDDLGIMDLFSEPYRSYIINNHLDLSELDDYMREDYERYFEDIECESSSRGFSDRCQEELAEAKFENREIDDYFELKHEVDEYKEYFKGKNIDITKQAEYVEKKILFQAEVENLLNNDVPIDSYEVKNLYDTIADLTLVIYKIEDFEKMQDDLALDNVAIWLEDYEDKKDDYIEYAIDKFVDGYENSLEWVEFNFGKDSVRDLVTGKWNISVYPDFEAISEYIIDTDGRGNELAGWDGCEHEFYDPEDQEYIYIYQQDDYVYEKEDFEADNDEQELA